MTRKDYVLIARALKTTRENIEILFPVDDVQRIARLKAVDHAIYNLAHELQGENPRFEWHRFVTAANYQAGIPSGFEKTVGAR